MEIDGFVFLVGMELWLMVEEKLIFVEGSIEAVAAAI